MMRIDSMCVFVGGHRVTCIRGGYTSRLGSKELPVAGIW